MAALARDLEPFMDECIRSLAANVHPKRQQSLLVGRALLKFVLVTNGFLQQHQVLPKIAYNRLNKPFFVDFPVHFNISHSHGWIALAVGPEPQGLDLELIDFDRKLRPALLKRTLLDSELDWLYTIQSETVFSPSSDDIGEILNPKEQLNASITAHHSVNAICSEPCSKQSIRSLKSPNTNQISWSHAAYEFFFLQWTLKECLLKLQGSSIFALDCLRFFPELKQVKIQSNSLNEATKDHSLPWFNLLQSFKLSSLYAKCSHDSFSRSTSSDLLARDFWLSLATYTGRSLQVRVWKGLPSSLNECKQNSVFKVNTVKLNFSQYTENSVCLHYSQDGEFSNLDDKLDHLSQANKTDILPKSIVRKEFSENALCLEFSRDYLDMGDKRRSGGCNLNREVDSTVYRDNAWELVNCTPDVIYSVQL